MTLKYGDPQEELEHRKYKITPNQRGGLISVKQGFNFNLTNNLLSLTKP